MQLDMEKKTMNLRDLDSTTIYTLELPDRALEFGKDSGKSFHLRSHKTVEDFEHELLQCRNASTNPDCFCLLTPQRITISPIYPWN
jgi:hypothetical protein